MVLLKTKVLSYADEPVRHAIENWDRQTEPKKCWKKASTIFFIRPYNGIITKMPHIAEHTIRRGVKASLLKTLLIAAMQCNTIFILYGITNNATDPIMYVINLIHIGMRINIWIERVSCGDVSDTLLQYSRRREVISLYRAPLPSAYWDFETTYRDTTEPRAHRSIQP